MSIQASPIPIKNLFYMLCYAWNVLAVMDDVKVGSDDYDDAYNLLARFISTTEASPRKNVCSTATSVWMTAVRFTLKAAQKHLLITAHS